MKALAVRCFLKVYSQYQLLYMVFTFNSIELTNIIIILFKKKASVGMDGMIK